MFYCFYIYVACQEPSTLRWKRALQRLKPSSFLKEFLRKGLLNKLIGDDPGAVEQFWQEAAQDSFGALDCLWQTQTFTFLCCFAGGLGSGTPGLQEPQKGSPKLRKVFILVTSVSLRGHFCKSNPSEPSASAHVFALRRFLCCCISTKAKAPKQGRCGSLARSSSSALACARLFLAVIERKSGRN